MTTLLYIVGIYLLISIVVYVSCVVGETYKYRNGKYTAFPVNKINSHKTYVFVGLMWFPLLCTLLSYRGS